MGDSWYYENRGLEGPNKDPNMWPKVKLIDLGDGTYAVAVRDATPATSNSYLNIAGAATTLVKTGAGVLKRIVYNKPISSSVVTVYDSLTATGTKIATITNPLVLLQQQLWLDFDLAFTNGLTVKTSAADDITVIFR